MNDELVAVDAVEVADGRTCSAYDAEEDEFCERGAAYLVEFSNGSTYPLCEADAEIDHL